MRKKQRVAVQRLVAVRGLFDITDKYQFFSTIFITVQRAFLFMPLTALEGVH